MFKSIISIDVKLQSNNPLLIGILVLISFIQRHTILAKIEDLQYLYITVIRPISEYACTVWNHHLSSALTDQLEYYQRKTLQIFMATTQLFHENRTQTDGVLGGSNHYSTNVLWLSFVLVSDTLSLMVST